MNHILGRLNLDRVSRFVYELVLLLTVLIILFAPLHSAATRHFNISKTLGPSAVSFIADDKSNLAVADMLPVYRFQEARDLELGRVRVEEIRGDQIICSFKPEDFVYPIGRHGRVVKVDWPRLEVDIGSRLGLKPGDLLVLFKGREPAGTVRLSEVSDLFSRAQVVNGAQGNLLGLTVSEYALATQVAFFNNRFLSLLEILFFIFVPLTYAYFFIFRRQSLLGLSGERLRAGFRRLPAVSLIASIVAGFLCVWFTVTFLARFISYFLPKLIFAGNYFFNLRLPVIDAASWFKTYVWSLYASGIFIYFYLLFRQKRSPILLFWERVSFRSKENRLIKSRSLRDTVIWILHLIIAYAFGRSLLIFLQANLNTVLDVAWHNPGVSLRGSLNPFYPRQVDELIRNSFFALGYVLTHPARFANVEAFFSVVRYLLYSLNIIGCLFGYGHSILGYFWGKRIRNLDFTVMGWFTNAICYGPLLGIIIWQMIPNLAGRDPIITQGPLYFFVLVVEFLLNLFYTLSIWNLGKMFGVMTDKGVRSSKFYSIVRHPSYTLEALMFMVLFIKGLTSLSHWLAVMIFIFIYYLRSEREDNFMSNSNPAYIPYKQNTPYKFIPGLY